MVCPWHAVGQAVQTLLPGLGLAAVLWFLIPHGRSAVQPRSRRKKGDDPFWENCGLSREEIVRFSRQLVLPKLGVEGQKALLASRVLVIGAGGLGCPVALYLSAAGVGALGIVDGDTVDVSNLHRQVAHRASRVGMNKALSLQKTCLAVNGLCAVTAYPRRLMCRAEAAELCRGYDLIIDCTDAPGSRYMMNDAALQAGRPLLAVSSVGLSGQLALYGLKEGPCLRCVFPTAPGNSDAEEPVANCQESGVLGPVCGVMGSLAALEAVKFLAGGQLEAAGLAGRLLLFDALDPARPCQSMKIKRRQGCPGCSGHWADDGKAPSERRVPCADLCADPIPLACAACVLPSTPAGLGLGAAALRERLGRGEPTLLLDVRPSLHYKVAHLSNSTNWPLAEIRGSARELREKVDAAGAGGAEPMVVCICRRGVDSLTATKRLRDAGVCAWNLERGLQSFAATSEPVFERPALT